MAAPPTPLNDVHDSKERGTVVSLLRTRVPTIAVSSIICLALGVLGGVLVTTMFGYQLSLPINPMMSEKGKVVRAAFEKELARAKGNVPKGSSLVVATLVSLVAKLDQLQHKPLKVELDQKQQREIAAQLEGLADLKELTDEEANTRLEALLKVVAGQRATLEMAGFRWPGAQAPPLATGPNPFQEETNRQHLQALQQPKVGP